MPKIVWMQAVMIHARCARLDVPGILIHTLQ